MNSWLPSALRCSRRSAAIVAIATVSGAFGGGGVAHADERREALKLAGEGLDLFDAGEYAAALEKFRGADALLPAPTLKLRIARCLNRLDRMTEAAATYREVISTAVDAEKTLFQEARKQAVADLAKLRKNLPSVVVLTRGPGADLAEVTIDGELLPPEMLGRRYDLDPGHHTFAARAGKNRGADAVDFKRGDRRRVTLTLSPPASLGKSNTGAFPYATWGWTSLGIGAVGLVVGGVAGLMAVSSQSDLEGRCGDGKCPPDAHDDAQALDRERAVSTLGFVLAGVGAAAGTTFLLLDPGDGASKTGARVSPFLTLGGAGLRGTF